MSAGHSAKPVVLKHIQEWRKAAGDTDSEAKQQAFINGCVQLKIAEPDRKQWYVEMTAILSRYSTATLTPANITEILQWMEVLRQKWGKLTIEGLSQIVVKIHKKDVAGANGQTERTRVVEWLENVGLGVLSFGKVQTFCNSLDLGVPLLLSEMWVDAFCGKATIKTLLGPGPTMPAWMLDALRHKRECTAPLFWMKALSTDALVIGEIASVIYRQGKLTQWQNEINAFACSLVRIEASQVKKFLMMFPDWAQWNLLKAEFDAQFNGVPAKHYPKKVTKVSDLIPASRKRIGSNQEDQATLPDLGQWLVHYREVIARLIRQDYPPEIIIGMYRHGLGHREMLAVTWIRGTAVQGPPAVPFKCIGPNGQVAHGFIFAEPKHLAERHLYVHFQFNRPLAYAEDEIIKDLNSFHPRGTTLQQHANLHQRNDMIVSNQDGLTDVANYKIATKVWNGNRKVATLYPNVGANHQDRFTRRQLERIRDVMATFPQQYVNALPEVDYFAPARLDRP